MNTNLFPGCPKVLNQYILNFLDYKSFTVLRQVNKCCLGVIDKMINLEVEKFIEIFPIISELQKTYEFSALQIFVCMAKKGPPTMEIGPLKALSHNAFIFEQEEIFWRKALHLLAKENTDNTITASNIWPWLRGDKQKQICDLFTFSLTTVQDKNIKTRVFNKVDKNNEITSSISCIECLDFNQIEDFEEIIDKDFNDEENIKTTPPNISFLQFLPWTITAFKALKEINLKGSNFEVFPEPLCHLPLLEDVDLSYCGLKIIPEGFFMKALKILSLENNQLTSLPHSFKSCTLLTTINLSSNNFSANFLKTFFFDKRNGLSFNNLTYISIEKNPEVLREEKEEIWNGLTNILTSPDKEKNIHSKIMLLKMKRDKEKN